MNKYQILTIFAIVGVLWLITFVLQAIGLYKMAKKVGAKRPFLAFVPFAYTLLVEELACVLVQAQQLLSAAGFGVVPMLFGHLQTYTLGQEFHGFGEGEVFNLHNEVEHTAALAATEAVVNLLCGCNGEGGGLFTVEGAQTKQV